MISIMVISSIIRVKMLFQERIKRGLSLGLLSLLSACGSPNLPEESTGINSPYNDIQPSLSGNGRYLSWVSNRNGRHQVLLYDLSQERFVPLSGVNTDNVLTESPSLSRTGRYIAYLVSRKGRPEIALYDRFVEETVILTESYPYWVRNPDLDLDGRYVVFETARRGQWDVEIIDRGPDVEPDILDGTRIYDTR